MQQEETKPLYPEFHKKLQHRRLERQLDQFYHYGLEELLKIENIELDIQSDVLQLPELIGSFSKRYRLFQIGSKKLALSALDEATTLVWQLRLHDLGNYFLNSRMIAETYYKIRFEMNKGQDRYQSLKDQLILGLHELSTVFRPIIEDLDKLLSKDAVFTPDYAGRCIAYLESLHRQVHTNGIYNLRWSVEAEKFHDLTGKQVPLDLLWFMLFTKNIEHNLFKIAFKRRFPADQLLPVTLRVRVTETTFEICAEDTAGGFQFESNQIVPSIWDGKDVNVFELVEGNSQTDGQGIYLTTLKKIIESLGGRVECSDINEGARIVISIPLFEDSLPQ